MIRGWYNKSSNHHTIILQSCNQSRQCHKSPRGQVSANGYCTAQVTWDGYSDDMSGENAFQLDRDGLNRLLKQYFDTHQLSACWQTIKETPNHMLITALSMICPFSAQEKQALLESPTCESRAKCLRTMLEMSVAENGCCEHSSSCC